jgi:hypothetical protein
MSITGTANFNDESQNLGVIEGTVTFSDDAQNNGIVVGDAFFEGNAENNSLVEGDANFLDNSKNDGTVEGDANFFEYSSNEGLVTGEGTFDDQSINIGTVDTIDLKGTATDSGDSKKRKQNTNGTSEKKEKFVPFLKSNGDGLYYMYNAEWQEVLAENTYNRAYRQGEPFRSPQILEPFYFINKDGNTTRWDDPTGGKFQKGLIFYEKALKYLEKINFNILPVDGEKYGIYDGYPEEWALFMTRMAYHESGYNPDAFTTNGGVSYGTLQLGRGSNSLYQVSSINGSYRQWTPDELKNDDLQINIFHKILVKNLTADKLDDDGNVVVVSEPKLQKSSKRILIAFGVATGTHIVKELSATTKYYTYEYGNSNPPVLANGCYTNGFYIYGTRDRKSHFVPTLAKDTDPAVMQQAVLLNSYT